ncbi:MAG: serine hydrolase [Patescibacteria group bacterium]
MMTTRIQALLLVLIILISVAITRTQISAPAFSAADNVSVSDSGQPRTVQNTTFDLRASVGASVAADPQFPRRKWDVLDPRVDAEALLVQSLDTDFPFFRLNTYTEWPMASLTKLLTAVTVLEDMGSNKKIPISETAVETEGFSGELKSGEVYSAEDLLKILLMVSSNDAAVAFEEYGGGKEKFVSQLAEKAKAIAMNRVVLKDASGLSDTNVGTANDLLKLVRYIVERHPDIFSWTRLPVVVVQPLNSTTIKTIENIDPLVTEKNFLGGKTGTSPAARENLVALFSFHNQRIAMIILGSRDRMRTAREILKWVEEAYQW